MQLRVPAEEQAARPWWGCRSVQLTGAVGNGRLQLAGAAQLNSQRRACAGSGKLAGVIGLRVWRIEGEVPSALSHQQGALPLPLAGRGLPGHQVQLTVMQTYRITMQSVLRASGCAPQPPLCLLCHFRSGGHCLSLLVAV